MGCIPEHLWPAVNYSLAAGSADTVTVVAEREPVGGIKATVRCVEQLDHVMNLARHRDPSSRFAIYAQRAPAKEHQAEPSPDPIVSTLIT